MLRWGVTLVRYLGSFVARCLVDASPDSAIAQFQSMLQLLLRHYSIADLLKTAVVKKNLKSTDMKKDIF